MNILYLVICIIVKTSGYVTLLFVLTRNYTIILTESLIKAQCVRKDSFVLM